MGELAVGFNIPEYITEEVKEYIKDESNRKLFFNSSIYNFVSIEL